MPWLILTLFFWPLGGILKGDSPGVADKLSEKQRPPAVFLDFLPPLGLHGFRSVGRFYTKP